MQRFFSVLVIFGILIIGGGYLWIQKSDESAKEKVEQTRANARRAFQEKARMAVRDTSNDGYLRSIQTAIRSYEEELVKQVYAKKPKLRDPTAYEKEVERSF